MSALGDMIRRMGEAGATSEVIAIAAECMEGVQPKPSKAAERTRRWREGKASQNVTERHAVTVGDKVSSPFPSLEGSPKPPPITLTLSPPSKSPTESEPAKAIFLAQPVQHRRSTTPDIRRALAAAIKRGGSRDEIVSACQAYYAQPDQKRDDGKFAKAAHRIIECDRWRDYLPTIEPPPVLSASQIARFADHYRQTGEWKPAWGQIPEEIAA